MQMLDEAGKDVKATTVDVIKILKKKPMWKESKEARMIISLQIKNTSKVIEIMKRSRMANLELNKYDTQYRKDNRRD